MLSSPPTPPSSPQGSAEPLPQFSPGQGPAPPRPPPPAFPRAVLSSAKSCEHCSSKSDMSGHTLIWTSRIPLSGALPLFQVTPQATLWDLLSLWVPGVLAIARVLTGSPLLLCAGTDDPHTPSSDLPSTAHNHEDSSITQGFHFLLE